ncbi:MAG: TRAP transporter small permease [Xanthobacteraceae bacterium]
MASFRNIYDRVLEAIAAILMVAVTVIVVAGFVFRWVGESLVWYDEVAAISLAWLTYYAGALAALRGAHLGFAGFVNSLPTAWRVAMTVLASGITIFFFVLLGITGYEVIQVISGLTLVSLPDIQQQWVASVIPITSVLFVISELLRLPSVIEDARRGAIIDPEIKEALETAQAVDNPAGRKGGPT